MPSDLVLADRTQAQDENLRFHLANLSPLKTKKPAKAGFLAKCVPKTLP